MRLLDEHEHEHAAPRASGAWPLLSARELRRLRFLAYCRATGRFRPAAPVRPEVEVLCASLLGDRPRLEGPSATNAAPPPVATRGLPLLWQAWLERQR